MAALFLQDFDLLMTALEKSAPVVVHVIDPGRPWLDGIDDGFVSKTRTA